MSKPALGKGLGALIRKSPSNAPDPSAPRDGEMVRKVGLKRIVPSPLQPRRHFQEAQLEELKLSIQEHGIIQPLIVRETPAGLELIAGERRFRASSLLGLAEVPVIIRQASDRDVLEMALIENIQREDLDPIEEAEAYDRLRRDFSLKQEEVAAKVGKSRATVANAIRLLELEPPIRDMLASRLISTGHAKAILSLKETEARMRLAQEVVRAKLNVRQTERKAAAILNPPAPKHNTDAETDPHILAVEKSLRDHLSTQVRVHYHAAPGDDAKAKTKGRIEITFHGTSDLNRILDAIGIADDAP